MAEFETTVCRARFLLPLADPDPGLRVEDGYVLAKGELLAEVGAYTAEIGRGLVDRFGSRLGVVTRGGIVSARSLVEGETLEGGETQAPIPCLNGALLPAFVKAHGHDHEQLLIGIAKDEPLTSWLDHAVNPFTGFLNHRKRELEREFGCPPHFIVYRMARLCDIHYGITSSMVHHCNHNKYHLEEIARVNEAAGTTMIVAVGGQDRNYVAELLDSPEEAVERMNVSLRIGGLRHTSFCPGPDQLFSNSRKVLMPLKAWARKQGTLFHTHSSEEPRTTRWFGEEVEPGRTPVEYAEEIGILDRETVLAHQVNCGARDIEILARTGTKVVHNPLANTILGSGMPPLMEMLGAGIDVAISTDGSGSADNQNILAAARLAAQYQKAFHQDATLLPSVELLGMITRVPAGILRMNQGELAPGRQADWVVVGLERPNMVPTRLDNVMENLVWAADGSEIDFVVARGRLLKAGGRVLSFRDGTRPDEILESARRLSERFARYRETAPELKGTGSHR